MRGKKGKEGREGKGRGGTNREIIPCLFRMERKREGEK